MPAIPILVALFTGGLITLFSLYVLLPLLRLAKRAVVRFITAPFRLVRALLGQMFKASRILWVATRPSI